MLFLFVRDGNDARVTSSFLRREADRELSDSWRV
jgi:hypothetical protein